MTLLEALYGRSCRSPIGCLDIGEGELIGWNLMHQALEKKKIINDRLKTTQSHRKSYSNICSRDLEFKEDDCVFLKVSPLKGVMRFGMKGKLSPRIPIAILDREVQKLRNKEISSAKVLWQNQQVEEATWEAEEEMKKKYPHLFE
ncbi:uncharacterized protein [Nicotiana sylvestris]|uniref:uncharacterized protein n=1 Tax=Nicotiana sylvestris TaxID=4096 RepID=UPI00388CA265